MWWLWKKGTAGTSKTQENWGPGDVVGAVESLHVYPIKACAGISLQSSLLSQTGLMYDRRFMIVNAHTKDFVTQREFPALALVQTSFQRNMTELWACAPGMPDLLVSCLSNYPLDPPGAEKYAVRVWKDMCDAVDLGDVVAEWFSTFLKSPVRVVRMSVQHQRKLAQKYVNMVQNKSAPMQASFADGFPFLLASKASIDAMGGDIRRFRPNIVVSGCSEFAEDDWKSLRIGDSILHNLKPCGRCVVTTVDPDRGVFSEDGQPLKTLKTTRNHQAVGPAFGVNLVHEKAGPMLRVGMDVALLAKAEEPLSKSFK